MVGARNSSGTITVLPQNEHFKSACPSGTDSAAPQVGQLKVLASAIFALIGNENDPPIHQRVVTEFSTMPLSAQVGLEIGS